MWCRHTAHDADLASVSYHMTRRISTEGPRAQFARLESGAANACARTGLFNAHSAADLAAARLMVVWPSVSGAAHSSVPRPGRSSRRASHGDAQPFVHAAPSDAHAAAPCGPCVL